MTTSNPQTSVFSALIDEVILALEGTHLFESVTAGEDAGSLHRFPACVLIPDGASSERVSAALEMRSYTVLLVLAVRSADPLADVKRLLDVRAAVHGLLNGAVFSNVAGHFDTIITSAPDARGSNAASLVRTTLLKVEMLTAEAM